MSKATETLLFLANHNSWRRGDDTFPQTDPAELGAALDDAVNLLRRYDELERENAALRVAGSEMYRILTIPGESDFKDWATEPEIDRAIARWKEAQP